MKLLEPENKDYAGVIVRLPKPVALEGLDNLVGLQVLGSQALVAKTSDYGELALVFTAGTQLSEEFAYKNNLYRHGLDLEKVIIRVWNKNSNKIVTNTPIERLIAEECAKAAGLLTITKSTQNTQKNVEKLISDGEISIKKSLLKKLSSGDSKTQKNSQNNEKAIKRNTQKTNEQVVEDSMTSLLKTRNSKKLSNAETEPTLSQHTVSQSNSTTNDMMSWKDVVKYVENGGKLSSLTTTILQELPEDFSAKGVTSLSLGLAIVERVYKELSITSPKLQTVFDEYKKNENQAESGYLEDNRHVRSLKLRGHRSDALVVRLEALSYIKKLDLSQFNEGDTFDRIGDHEICRKFMRKPTRAQKTLEKNKKIFTRVDEKFLPQHYDTDNYFKNSHVIPENADVTVTQKLHGTSLRIGHVPVKRKVSIIERFLIKIGIAEYE